jgi:hypothetical protein
MQTRLSKAALKCGWSMGHLHCSSVVWALQPRGVDMFSCCNVGVIPVAFCLVYGTADPLQLRVVLVPQQT